MGEDELVKTVQELQMNQAYNKIAYWQEAGAAILDDDELAEKWRFSVESMAKDIYERGSLMDETLQIMTMIKLNVPLEVIAQIIKKMPGGKIVLNERLGAFIHPEILDEIKSNMDSKTKSEID